METGRRKVVRPGVLLFVIVGMGLGGFLPCASAQPIGAGLDFQDSHAVFDVGGNHYATHYIETGLTFRQWLVPSLFNLGLRGGYLSVTQDPNPVVSGANIGGEYIGLDAGFRYNWIPLIGFRAYASETYHRSSTTTKIGVDHINWYGFHARAGADLQIGIVGIGAGVFYRRATGHEPIPASQPESVALFENESGPYASVTLYPAVGGSVTLLGEGGRWHSYLLTFRYGF